jgi:RNA polymerase sigma-70 factor, ECF subfamily
MMLWGTILAAGGLLLLQVTLRSKQDRDLARRLQQRDARAMGPLYDRYGRLIYSLIYRIVRNPATAEDLVQETFLRVWNRAQSFDAEKGSLGAWILTVGRNRAIDHLRSAESRLEQRSLELDLLDQPILFSNFEDTALTVDRARQIKIAFERLTPHQKSVIEMAYYEGLSQTEMAEKLNQPLGTIKTWVRSALRSMREELTEEATA